MFTRTLAGIALLLGASVAQAQGLEPIEPQKVEPITFTSEEMRILETYKHTLFGGRPIEQGELPISVYIGNCTATIIGKDTILTAGHCRQSGSSASFVKDGRRYAGKCTRHPAYSQGAWLNNDFSLCKFSPEITLPVYASLAPKPMAKGDTIIMQGYGQGSNGVLNVGSGPIFRVESWQYLTYGNLQLGGGDSGGALFAKTTDMRAGPFEVVGVNSRKSNATSLFNRTDIEASQSFFRSWAKANNAQICGVSEDCAKKEIPSLCEPQVFVVKSVEKDLQTAKDELTQCIKDNQ